MMRDFDALLRFIADRANTPFGWEQPNDCVSFANKAGQAQTGRSHLGRLRWKSKDGARRVIEREGGIEAAMDKRLRRIAPALAQRGDVAGVPDTQFGLRLMIVEGATLVGPGSRGLRRSPRGDMVAAWSFDPASGGER